MFRRLVEAMREVIATGDRWTLMLGDCVERAAEIEDESVGLSVFSPPFPGMYVYSDSPRDMGNAAPSRNSSSTTPT